MLFFHNFSFYSAVEVLEIRCSKVTVKSAISGQSCTVMIKLGKSAVIYFENKQIKDNIRRGMVLVDGKSNPKAAYEFSAEIWLWDQNIDEKTLKISYQPVINTQTTRQSCKVIHEKISGDIKPELPEIKLTKKISKSFDNKKNQYFEENKTNENHITKKMSFINSKGKKQLTNSSQINEEQIKKIGGNEEFSELLLYEDKNKIKESKRKKRYSSIKILPNKKNVLRLRFMFYPEYILVGQKLLINDTSLKAIGWIKEIYY